MKKIKWMAGLACSAVFALMADPFAAMAATQAEERSFGQTMQYALLNTVMGIVIVFLVLLLISRIIALFKYINRFAENQSKKEEAVAPVQSAAAAPVSEEPEEEELSDDLELVAVITAAIHAYEEEQGNDIPAGELVVRSIRKAAKWKNA